MLLSDRNHISLAHLPGYSHNKLKKKKTQKMHNKKIIEEIKAKDMFTIQLNDRKSSSEWRKIKVETELFAPRVILS